MEGRIEELEEQMSAYAENGTVPTGEAPEDWLKNIKTEMESCEKHRDEYLSEKASYDMFITRIDCLLRWIDYATKAFPASNSPEYFRMVEERVGMMDEGACSDVDFFRRTDRSGFPIHAGWKTVFVWLWAKMFYAHRQRKWIRLLGGSE